MHLFITSPSISDCKKCGKPVKSHTVCLNCGFYKGKEVINVLASLTRKDKKSREKERGLNLYLNTSRKVIIPLLDIDFVPRELNIQQMPVP